MYQSPRDTSRRDERTYSIFVRNPSNLREDQLRDHFERFGTVHSIKSTYSYKGERSGNVIIHFYSPEAQAHALNDATQECKGCRLYVEPRQGTSSHMDSPVLYSREDGSASGSTRRNEGNAVSASSVSRQAPAHNTPAGHAGSPVSPQPGAALEAMKKLEATLQTWQDAEEEVKDRLEALNDLLSRREETMHARGAKARDQLALDVRRELLGALTPFLAPVLSDRQQGPALRDSLALCEITPICAPEGEGPWIPPIQSFGGELQCGIDPVPDRPVILLQPGWRWRERVLVPAQVSFQTAVAIPRPPSSGTDSTSGEEAGAPGTEEAGAAMPDVGTGGEEAVVERPGVEETASGGSGNASPSLPASSDMPCASDAPVART